MNKQITSIAGLVFLGLCAPGRGHAQEQEMNQDEISALYLRTQITVNGKQTPHLIPYHTKMKLFFNRYNTRYREELRKILSSEDDAKLAKFAEGQEARREQQEREFSARFLMVCSAAESMEPLDLAKAVESHNQQAEALLAKRYKEAVGGISREGQRTVEEFVAERIRPVVTRDNPVAIATEAPEWFKRQTVADCRYMIAGTTPPPPHLREDDTQQPAPAASGDASSSAMKATSRDP